MDPYKDRIEKNRLEQIERQKLIDRDSVPYNPKKMRSGMPCGCTIILGFILSSLIVGGTWFLVKWMRGG